MVNVIIFLQEKLKEIPNGNYLILLNVNGFKYSKSLIVIR